MPQFLAAGFTDPEPAAAIERRTGKGLTMELTTNQDRLATKFKQLDGRATNFQLTLFFPTLGRPLQEYKATAMEYREEFLRLATAADAEGLSDLAKQARKSAEQMSDLKQKWQSRIDSGWVG
jgi:hypothetical protein